MADVRLTTPRGELPSHLATPSGAGAWPGVIVIHEAFGLTDDIRGIADRFAERPECSGRAGVIGFCMGGGFALLAAPRPGFHAAGVNYGRMPDDAERVLEGACPIVASYGGRDRGLRGHAERLGRALTTLGVEHDLKTYPEAGHSFLNHNRGLTAFVLGKIFNVGYHGPSAEDAWQRILTFFDTHLPAAREPQDQA